MTNAPTPNNQKCIHAQLKVFLVLLSYAMTMLRYEACLHRNIWSETPNNQKCIHAQLKVFLVLLSYAMTMLRYEACLHRNIWSDLRFNLIL